MTRVVQSSVVRATPERVWQRVTTFEGINHELGPWLSMTMPRAARDLTLETVPLDTPIGRSWILLLRVLPVDYDDLKLAELEPGRRFLERSTLLSMSSWEHERVVEEHEDGARVTDRLTFELRGPLRAVPGSRHLAERIVGFLFRHRHRRLARRFGS